MNSQRQAHQQNQQNQTEQRTTPAALSAGCVWQPRGRAWLLSLVAHGLLLVLALWGFTHAPEEPLPTIRLVFAEPPPPPPAPLGTPAATDPSPASTPSVVEKKPQVVKKPKKKVKPKRKEPKRLKVAKKPKKSKKEEKPPQPEPEPIEQVEPVAAVSDAEETDTAPPPHAGLAAGSVNGVPGGAWPAGSRAAWWAGREQHRWR